ncbi:MAG: oxygen-independent coproporphyrinogen III oxidase [Proteobacteria bacterium]|nr:MAG: oxygen-independent coproporphyrinogen III oxidase [Pseudomonadota bacterium]
MSLDFDHSLLEKYDTQGPRYTSYPTAPEFTDGFTARDYLDHVKESNDELIPRPLSLYIHIPFCRSLCYYCGCNKIVTQNEARAERYLEYLFHEIEIQSKLFATDRLVTQIHFGGGTPNFLNTDQFRELLGAVARHFHLSYPEDLEISIEIDPRFSNAAQITELASIGFSRISIGVQDYEVDVQRTINRIQTREQVETVVNAARASGIRSVSVDLVVGLPHQTRNSFAETLQQVVESKVDRIAIYGFAYLPERIKAQRMIPASSLPSRDTRLAIGKDTLEFLKEAGYVHIGMDHFALPDDSLAVALREHTLKRSFQGYATHAECDQVGLGVSAISQVSNSYSQNSSTLPEYYARLDAGELPIQRGISLSDDDLIRAQVIQYIMCQNTVPFHSIEAAYGIDFLDYFRDELQELRSFEQDGLVQYGNDEFTITPTGRFFLRNIAMVFDRYLKDKSDLKSNNVVRFSRTI